MLGTQGELETDLAGFAGRVRQLHLSGGRNGPRCLPCAKKWRRRASRGRWKRRARWNSQADRRISTRWIWKGSSLKRVPRLLKPAQGPGRVFCLSAGRNLAVISGSPALPANGLVNALKTRYGLSGGGSAAYAQCGPLPPDVTLDEILTLATETT